MKPKNLRDKPPNYVKNSQQENILSRYHPKEQALSLTWNSPTLIYLDSDRSRKFNFLGSAICKKIHKLLKT